MHIPECLLIAFPPAGESLLEATRCAVDDSMLREIAAADYGIDIERHLERLRIIRDEGRVAGIGGWHLWEVLELPEHPPQAFGATQGLWQPLGQELVQSSASIRTQSVRSDLELIGALLAE